MEYSVLMAVYKGDNPDYLRKSMLSMLNQSMPAEELVIVKDGPITKELQEVIDSIDNDFPGIIVQVDLRENIGLGLALIYG